LGVQQRPTEPVTLPTREIDILDLERWLDAETMQAIAMENNLSETAFFVGREGRYRIRWFTPAVEVDLCGHATLASAHVLWETNVLPRAKQPTFHTRSGALSARSIDDQIELDFPAIVPASPEQSDETALRAALSKALEVNPVAVMRSRFDVLVELESESAVRSLRPNFGNLRACEAARGVIVTATAEAGSRFDFVSRFFAPRAGVDEDPVTGSAHCALTPYWSKKLGKTEMLAQQVSSRGGVIAVSLRGDRVGLRGHAVTVVRGELLLR
jgi:PhzF family phenazine biosynthesis protein